MGKIICVLLIALSAWSCEALDKATIALEVPEVPTPESETNDIVVLLYMNGDNDLEQDIMGIINDIETLPEVGGIPVIVLVDRIAGENNDWTGTRAYRIRYDEEADRQLVSDRVAVAELGIGTEEDVELNMGSKATLQQFIKYGKRVYGEEASQIVLGITGQYSSWDNISEDSSESYTDGLTISEIGGALKNAGGVDYLLLDHMPMSIELWYEIGDSAGLITSSTEMLAQLPLWNYKGLVQDVIVAADVSTAGSADESTAGSADEDEAGSGSAVSLVEMPSSKVSRAFSNIASNVRISGAVVPISVGSIYRTMYATATSSTTSAEPSKSELIKAAIFDNATSTKMTMVHGAGASAIQKTIDTIGQVLKDYITTTQRQTEISSIVIGASSSISSSYVNPGAYFVDIESLALKLSGVEDIAQEIAVQYQKIQDAVSTGIIQEKSERADISGVLVYMAELQENGAANSVANQYRMNTTDTVLEFVKDTPGWSADLEKNSGALYQLWLDEKLPEEEPETKDIVVLLYMNGDNAEEENMLSSINEIETLLDVGSIPVLVLLDRKSGGSSDWTGTRAYKIEHDEIENTQIVSERLTVEELGIDKEKEIELNMGSKKTLQQFIKYGKRVYGEEDSKVVLSIMGAHTSWDNISEDNSETPADSLTISEIGEALESADGVDYLMLDHMPMTMELWYEIGTSADNIASSAEISSSTALWDYKAVVQDIISVSAANSDLANIGGTETGSAVDVDAGIKSAIFDNATNTRMTMVQGAGATDMQTVMNTIGQTVENYITTIERQEEISNILIGASSSIASSYSNPGSYFVDIESLALKLRDVSAISSIMAIEQQKIQDVVSTGVIQEKSERADIAGVLVYMAELRGSGEPHTVAGQYLINTPPAILKFVKDTTGWSADLEKSKGLLYQLWLNNTLPAEAPETKDTVILLYMNGDNAKEEDVMSIINQVETVTGLERIPVLALVDRMDASNDEWTGTRAYRIKHDAIENTQLVSERLAIDELGLGLEEDVELNMGSRTTLQNFVKYGKRVYGEENSKVVLSIMGQYSLWDNISEDNSELYIDGLTISEIGGALESAGDVDYLMLDHMPMTIELWYEIGSLASYIASSTDMTPLSPLWNYKNLVRDIVAVSGSSDSDRDIGIRTAIFDNATNTRMTMVQGGGAGAMQASMNEIGQIVSNYISTAARQLEISNIVIGASSSISSSYVNPGAYFVDIESVALKLKNVPVIANSINTEYEKIRNAINTGIIQEKEVHSNIAGVLIYIAELQESGGVNTVADQYRANTVNASLKFVKDTIGWAADLVKNSGLLYQLWLVNDLP